MKKSITKKKNSLKTILAVAFLFVFCWAIQAQNKNSNQVVNKKYVRVDIGHGAMHCPFLSPKLETQLKEIKGVENFFIDKQNSYATFNLPAETEMTTESLKQIGIDIGYPSDDVVITMDTKPIKTPAK